MKEIERILDLEAVESYGIDGSIEGINIFRSKALVICAEGIIYLGKERIREEEFISSAAGAGTKLFAIVYQEDENKHYLIEKYVDNGEEKITDLGEDVIENLVAFGDRLFAKKETK